MPRIYKRKIESFSPYVLQAVISKVQDDGASIRSVAQCLGISRETLRRWVLKRPVKAGAGRMRVLTDQEREFVVVALEKCALF